MPRLFSGFLAFFCQRPARDPTRSVVTEACDGTADDSGLNPTVRKPAQVVPGGLADKHNKDFISASLVILSHSESFWSLLS